MTDTPDLEGFNSQWFVGDLRYEAIIGEKMCANFSLHSGYLPLEMAELLGRLRDREISSPPKSRDVIGARPTSWRDRD